MGLTINLGMGVCPACLAKAAHTSGTRSESVPRIAVISVNPDPVVLVVLVMFKQGATVPT